VHGHHGAGLDAGGRVADDVLKVHGAQVGQHFFDTVLRQGVFVAGLRRRQHIQVVALLVFDQRLVQVGLAVDDIDQVIDHAALAAHDQVKVAQADVKVNHCRLVAAQGQTGCKAGAGGGLAHPALA